MNLGKLTVYGFFNMRILFHFIKVLSTICARYNTYRTLTLSMINRKLRTYSNVLIVFRLLIAEEVVMGEYLR